MRQQLVKIARTDASWLASSPLCSDWRAKSAR